MHLTGSTAAIACWLHKMSARGEQGDELITNATYDEKKQQIRCCLGNFLSI